MHEYGARSLLVQVSRFLGFVWIWYNIVAPSSSAPFFNPVDSLLIGWWGDRDTRSQWLSWRVQPAQCSSKCGQKGLFLLACIHQNTKVNKVAYAFHLHTLLVSLNFLTLKCQHVIFCYQARARRARARRACALRALGLLLADGTTTVGGGKTFWAVSQIFLRKQL